MERPMVIRIGGFAILALAALGAWAALAPAQTPSAPSLPSAATYDSLIAEALSTNELNDALADSAPQQSVVNGWVARDLLAIMAKENADLLRAQGAVFGPDGVLQSQPFDERVPALLLIGVLAIVWDGVTGRRPSRRRNLKDDPWDAGVRIRPLDAEATHGDPETHGADDERAARS